MNRDTLKDIQCRLVVYAVEEENQEATPNILEGQDDKQHQISLMKQGELESSIKRWMPNFTTQDPLVEGDLGTKGEPRMIKVSGLLAKKDRV